MQRTIILLATCLLLNGFQNLDAELNVIPRDTEVMVNDSTYMNCSTSLEAHKIHWRHGNNYVYAGTRILEPYNVRFSVEINSSTGTNNLVIRSVQPSDVGRYECLEDEGFGEQSSAQLIVLDDDPVCKSNMHSMGVIGPNDCDIEPDEVILSCSITYHGNVYPILQWKASGGNQSIAEGLYNITSIKNEVTYTLTMTSTLDLNNSSFICQTTRTSKRNYSCSSDVIKIFYAIDSKVTIDMITNDEVICFANTSQICSYKWKWYRGHGWIIVSNGQILKPNKVGLHRCEATCYINNKSCTVESMFAEVYSTPATSERTLMALLVLTVLPVIALIGVVVYFWKKSHNETNRNQHILTLSRDDILEENQDSSSVGLKRNVAKQESERKEQEQEQQRLIELEREEREQEQQSPIELEREEREQEQQSPIEELPEKYKLDPVLVQTIKTEVKTLVTGLTILDEELFVVSASCSEVKVYNSVKFNFSRRWKLKELIEPKEIGSCNRNKCLYIFDFKGNRKKKEILKVDPNGILITKWPTGGDRGLGLSVTDESIVISTVSTNNEHKLNEYSPDGQLVRAIDLSDAGIINPHHAIKLANGHFLVTRDNGNELLPPVCVVDAGGKLEKSFDGNCGSTIPRLGRPCYLAVDGNGFVMVVDETNERVLLLDSELKFKRELLSQKTHRSQYHLWKILMDQTTNQLLVTDVQKILIFSFPGEK